jgi:hypothetical protein
VNGDRSARVWRYISFCVLAASFAADAALLPPSSDVPAPMTAE